MKTYEDGSDDDEERNSEEGESDKGSDEGDVRVARPGSDEEPDGEERCRPS